MACTSTSATAPAISDFQNVSHLSAVCFSNPFGAGGPETPGGRPFRAMTLLRASLLSCLVPGFLRGAGKIRAFPKKLGEMPRFSVACRGVNGALVLKFLRGLPVPPLNEQLPTLRCVAGMTAWNDVADVVGSTTAERDNVIRPQSLSVPTVGAAPAVATTERLELSFREPTWYIELACTSVAVPNRLLS